MEGKRKRHFLYTWPMGAINKQAARPFANISQVHVRGQWALSEKLWVWMCACAAEWGQVEQAERRTPVRRGNRGAASYGTYSGEWRSRLCQVPIKFWRSLKGNYICSLFNTPDHSHRPRALERSQVHLDLHNAYEKSRYTCSYCERLFYLCVWIMSGLGCKKNHCFIHVPKPI